MRPARPAAQRFWEKVHKELGGCWYWVGKLNIDGYGTLGIKGIPARAHRVSYEAAVGPIPPGLVIRHTCDNRRCVNPEHLIAGTQKQNLDDMYARGRARAPLGEICGTSKLKAKQVLEIRASSKNNAQLSRDFGVSPSLISMIRSRLRWAHL